MFGPFWPNELREQAARAGEATIVSRERFIELMIADGKTLKEAEFQAKVSVGLGCAATLIGGKMWRISVDKPAAG